MANMQLTGMWGEIITQSLIWAIHVHSMHKADENFLIERDLSFWRETSTLIHNTNPIALHTHTHTCTSHCAYLNGIRESLPLQASVDEVPVGAGILIQ